MLANSLLMYNWDRYFKNEGIKFEHLSFEDLLLELHYIPKINLSKKSLFNQINSEEMIKENNFLKGFTYRINTKPKCKYHILLESEETNSVTKDSIKKLSTISSLTGTVFTYDSASDDVSLPNVCQGIIGRVPVMQTNVRVVYFQDKDLRFGNSVFSQEEIPWEHAVFKGERAPDFYLKALRTIKNEIPYLTTIIAGNEIHLVPKSMHKTKDGKPVGCIEFCGIQSFTSKKEYRKAKRSLEQFLEMRLEAGFPKKATVLQDFLEHISQHSENSAFFDESS